MQFDSDISYWVTNPQHKMIFSDIYKPDTSRDKRRSSLFMYGVALIYHIDSEIIEWREEDRIKLVSENIWKDYTKEFMEILSLVRKRMEDIDGGNTAGTRQMREWARLMDEKSEYMSTLHYNASNFEMIEKMLFSNGKLYDEYNRIMKILSQEQMEADRTLGGSQESLLEQGKFI